MATIKLTERSVSALPSPTDAPQAYYWDEELTGLGVVVGRTGIKTFVVYGRVAGKNGKRVKTKLGIFGQPRDDRHRWTVELARIEARKVLGKLAMGVNPNAPPDSEQTPSGPTVRDGVETHLAKMRKRAAPSARSRRSCTRRTSTWRTGWTGRSPS
jgi:hypothetical protein